MKNFATAFALFLLTALVVLLWRIDHHLAPLAESARLQMTDRAEARQLERERVAEQARLVAAAEAVAAEAARLQQAADAEAARLAREQAAYAALLDSPVKPGEIVEAIFLDNGSTINGAVVVSVQPTSVSFRAGAQLYNIPTEQLPELLRVRLQRMYPGVFAEGAPSAE